jgi:large subunit ribosomal protein L22
LNLAVSAVLQAAANAKQNLGLRKAKLYVSECFCDGGPRLKRFQPRAKGRPYQILKPISHLTVKVKER